MVSNNGVCLDDFKIMNFIEKGTFGAVFLAHLPREDKNYAIKCINKDKLIENNYIDRAKLEIDIM